MFGGSSNYDALDAQEAHEARKYLDEGKSQALVLLQEAIRTLNDEIAEQEHLTSAARPVTPVRERGSISRKVFIVHGHDEGAREAVARFLERIGFEAIILHEQPNQGRTVIEKVVAHSDVGFAVVLLTPDDEGCKKGETARPRARQNVLLELGYFVGRLGRERVCALTRGDIELPSDFGGVVYEPFDAGGGWRQALARELEAAGFTIDWNKVMRS
jgi:predicted nucleotide-binding protein